MLIDSHVNLHAPQFDEDRDAVIARAREAGVGLMVEISDKLSTFEATHALAMAHDNFWATVGVHPDSDEVQEPTLDDLLQRGRLPRVVGIGETGLDYYRLNGRTLAEMEWQRERFRIHIRAARELALPLVIHTRSASDHTLGILREEGEDGSSGAAGGVFHCFTETMEVARAALDMGFYISFSGIVTFRNAEDLRDVARYVPLDRMLIETDSPYLAPVPYRGKTNSPAYVPHVARLLAEVRKMAVESVAEITTRNFDALFPLANQDAKAHQDIITTI